MDNVRLKGLWCAMFGSKLLIGYSDESPCFIIGYEDATRLPPLATAQLMSSHSKRLVSGLYDRTNPYDDDDRQYLFEHWANRNINNIKRGLKQVTLIYSKREISHESQS